MGQKDLEEGQRKLYLDVIEVKNGQEKLQKDLIQSFGEYTEKMIQYTDDKTAALNKRVFNVETEMEKHNKRKIYKPSSTRFFYLISDGFF